MSALVYGISRWSNPNRAAARHLDSGQGTPLCGGNGRRVLSWERDEGEPTRERCSLVLARAVYRGKRERLEETLMDTDTTTTDPGFYVEGHRYTFLEPALAFARECAARYGISIRVRTLQGEIRVPVRRIVFATDHTDPDDPFSGPPPTNPAPADCEYCGTELTPSGWCDTCRIPQDWEPPYD